MRELEPSLGVVCIMESRGRYKGYSLVRPPVFVYTDITGIITCIFVASLHVSRSIFELLGVMTYGLIRVLGGAWGNIVRRVAILWCGYAWQIVSFNARKLFVLLLKR